MVVMCMGSCLTCNYAQGQGATGLRVKAYTYIHAWVSSKSQVHMLQLICNAYDIVKFNDLRVLYSGKVWRISLHYERLARKSLANG